MHLNRRDKKAKAYLQKTCPSAARTLLRVALLVFIAVSLIAGCATVRETPRPKFEQAQAKLDGQDVVVGYFKDYRRVQQAAPDLCWAACLEQALAFQGVDTDQRRVVEHFYSQADSEADRTINEFWLRQNFITHERLTNGSEVWARVDIDGGAVPSMLATSTFVRKISRELNYFRIPIVGISTEHGVGHMVTVVGFAIPIEVKRQITPADIVGFLIYDPLTAEPRLMSSEKLFKISKALVYVTTYDSATGVVTGEFSSTLHIW
jgi:hypothetical protein